MREKVKRGSEHSNYLDNTKYQSSPEQEYRRYRMYDRQRIELVRQWCGHRAISFDERLVAGEAENSRLDALVVRLNDALKGYPPAINVLCGTSSYSTHRVMLM